MATRMIVTSQPDVACDVCGRRLLRGEQPDVFLAAGRRRTVCELCAPRASHEGWLRESDQHHAVSLPPARARRGRNLLDRLRQLRDPVTEPPAATAFAESMPENSQGTSSYEFFDGGPGADEPPATSLETESDASFAEPVAPLGEQAATSVEAGSPGGEPERETVRPMPAIPVSGAASADGALTEGDAKARRALEVFNAGEHPRRVAGVARSLGAPSVTVSPLAQSGGTVVAIVVAWELSWYRYEVDLGDEASGVSVVAQGAELSELAAEELLANAAADAEGALSLVGSMVR